MYDRRATIELLEREGVAFELTEHPAVFTVEQARQANIPFAAHGAKNLFLRDDRHRAHYLICLPDEKSVSLREIQVRINSRRLSFASADDLARMLGLKPGSVTPLGALNDVAREVEVIVDEELVERERVAVHPCDNTATVLLATQDLIDLLRRHDVPLHVIRL